MRSAAFLLGAALALAACGSGGDDLGPTSTKLVPTSFGGIEGTWGGPDALGLSVLRAGTNVVVAHFRVADCPTVFSSVELRIPLHNLDPDPPDPDVYVEVFLGDGTVSLDEWDVGDPVLTLEDLGGEYPLGSVDVTALMQTCVDHSDPYLSFRLMCSEDRLDLGAVGGVEAPHLVVWP